MGKYIKLYATQAEYDADQTREGINVCLITATNTVICNGASSLVGKTSRLIIDDLYGKIADINDTLEPLSGKTVITNN